MVGRLLAAPTTVAELLAGISPEHLPDARCLLENLIEQGILTDIRRDPVEQYLRYTFTGDPQLSNLTVALIGVGPLGARIALNLLQHGVGKIRLLDNRGVDRLWYRFMPFGPDASGDMNRSADVVLADWLMHVGQSRVECLGRHDAGGLEEAVAIADVVVLALEQPDIRLSHSVNRYGISHRKPWLLVTIDGNRGLVGPLFIPTDTACYSDYRTLASAATPSPTMARKHRQHVLRRGAGSFFPGLPAYADIVAGHASLALVHFLLRGTCFAVGRVMTIDFDHMQIDVEDVLKLPRCPVCSTAKNAYRPLFPSHTETSP